MPPSSRGVSMSCTRLEPAICLQCRFRLGRHFSTTTISDSRLSLFPPITTHSRSPKLSLRSRNGKTRDQGACTNLRLADAQARPARLYHSSRQLPKDQIGRKFLPNRDARGRRTGNLTDDHVIRNFATHVESQPPKLDELSKLLHHSLHREKVDIKSKLRSWQQEYDKSDEAALPYIASFGGNATIRAKARHEVDVVQNLKDRAVPKEDDDEALGYGIDIGDTPGLAVSKTAGVEAGFLQKGDMVELQAKGGSLLSVFLRAIGEEHEFLTINGILTHQKLNNVHLSISPFVDPKLLKPLLSQLPPQMSDEDDVDTWAPRESSAPVLKALLDFDRAAKDFYQQHAAKLDNMHDDLALEKDFRYMTTREIAGHVIKRDFNKIQDHELLAVHRSLMKIPVGFRISYRYHRFTHSVEIIPKRVVRSFKKAVEWLRDLQEASIAQAHLRDLTTLPFQIKHNPVGPFLAKAQKLIAASRLNRSTSKAGRIGSDSNRLQQLQENGLAMTIDGQQMFTQDEAHLVRFIRFWVVDSHISSPYAATLDALGSRLVRATGCYDDFDISRSTGFTFLQEIGTMLPWDTRIGWDHRLRFRDQFPGLKVDRMWQDAAAEARQWMSERPTDIMKNLRKDWGSLEVFSIDPVIATIIDDGFSIEEVQDDPGTYWLHIHIANPTCYVQPDNDIAIHAKEMMTTTHFPEQSHHMVHPNTVRDFFNIGPGQPVLTFSAKVDLQGKLLDKSICPGVIHNCIRLDSASVQEALQPGSMADAPWVDHIVGNPPDRETQDYKGRAKASSYQHVGKDQLEKLRLIQKLALARARKRPFWAIMRFRNSLPMATATFPRRLYDRVRRRDNPTVVYKTSGDPEIKVQAVRYDPLASTEKLLDIDNIVDDTMILACEIAGLWCKERNIPNIYRATVRNTEVISPEQFQEEVVKPAIERTGKPPFLLIKEYARKKTRSLLSATPMAHEGLGLEAYVRVTSPLRRYGEMVAHWQIESALRYEHETGKSLVGCENSESFLTFTREQIESLFVRMIEAEVTSNFAAMSTTLSWISMFFFRAHYHGEGNLPPTLSVFIQRVDSRKRTIGTLEIMNMDVRVMETDVSDAENGLQIGDWWDCKIAEVDTYQNKITMHPVKLLDRKGNEMCLDLQSRIEIRKD